MFYAWDITVSAATPEGTPVTQILKLTKGVITRLDVKFAPGCHRLVKVRVLRSEFQLVPLSRGEWVTGDGETVVTEPYYGLDTAPYELKFVGCAPQTVYNHVITVRVSMQPEEIAAPWKIISSFIEIIKRLMGI